MANNNYKFFYSRFGICVGVLEEEEAKVFVKFEKFNLPEGAKSFDDYRKEKGLAPGQEIANVSVLKRNPNPDVGYSKAILRVYLTEEENTDFFTRIYAYKKPDGWKELDGVDKVTEGDFINGWWRAFLEVPIDVGDPPIAVG